MMVTMRSPISGKVNSMDLDITEAAIDAWKAGTLIQEAMPNLSSDEREFIMTGIHGDEWASMIKDEEYIYGKDV